MLEALGIDQAFRRGTQLMCHCPNTDNHKNGDLNPSFGYNEDKMAYNCFVCGGGNVVELVQMMMPETSDEDAVKFLEQYADFNRSEDDLEIRLRAILNPQDDDDSTLPEYPPENLFQYRKIHPYLYKRGLTREVIVEMQVGYDDEHMGITIPHFFMGKLVGMQRRHLGVDDDGNYFCPRCSVTDKKVPKYKNTARFPKVNTLYGYDQMKEALRQEEGNSAIVIESPFSLLKLKSLGFNRVTATFGQFSTEQGMLLIAVPKVYFWPDNDSAGYKNAKKAIEVLGHFVDLWIVPVVEGEKGDPGDLDAPMQVFNHLKMAYPSALFDTCSPYGHLATLEEMRAREQ
jgi:DNA primase